MTTVQSSTAADRGEPYIERLVIRHFRGIEACEIELEPTLTVLAGRNNVGKSRILSALQLALGGRPADVDDFTVGTDNEPEIDVVVAPAPPASVADDDEFTSVIARQFQGWVQSLSEEPLRERLGWRTTVKRSGEGFAARAESKLLVFDNTARRWAQRADAPSVNRSQRGIFAVDLINTGRDLLEELGRRGSNIRKVLSDLEVPGEQREPLEQELEALSVKILANSDTLRSLTEALAALHALIGSMGAPALHPLPAKLEELARLISIDLDTGAGALPVRMHGAGSRSLAALQVQSVLYDKRLGKDGTASSPNPVTLVEEPEAHLHPQASMELEPLLSALRGQKIVSTHSAHLVTTIEPRAIRLIRHRTDGLQVIDLGPSSSDATATHRAFRPDLHVEEMEKLKRFVERPFGEMLYASAIVIGDGATERAFLPPVLRHALGNQAHGVCVIDPESLAGDSARAAVKFATMTETPWVAFADSDPAGQQAIATLLALGDGDKARVVWINSVDSEGVAVPGDIEAMLLSFDAGICHAACLAVRPDLAATPTKKLLDKLKGSVGASLAQQLIVTYPDSRDWPNPLQELIARLRIELS